LQALAFLTAHFNRIPPGGVFPLLPVGMCSVHQYVDFLNVS